MCRRLMMAAASGALVLAAGPALAQEAVPTAPAAGEGVTVTAERYRAAGLTDVEVKLYPQARHEVLNETNRDEVTADIITFLDRVVPLGE